MEFRAVRHCWGFDHPVPHQARTARSAGYRALEVALLGEVDADALGGACADQGLDLVIQIHTDDFRPGGSVETHLADFRAKLARARAMGAVFVNSHSGRDEWSPADATRFFREAVAIAEGEGVSVVHETHRSRCLYSPFATRDLCAAVPELRLTADFSHWTCVCERIFAHDEPVILDLVDRVDYVHGRVGHSQGPQVNDPRAPEHAETLAAFEAWWSAIWRSQAGRGAVFSWFCPEFGPQPYLPALPYTGQPVAPLETICDWMLGRAQGRFATLQSA